MNKKLLNDKISQTSVELERLQNDLCAIERTDIALYPDNFFELTASAALRSERITCALRQCVFLPTNQRPLSYLEAAAEAQGISVTHTNDLISITLPSLLPKRKSGAKCDFLMEPLFYCLREYSMTNDVPRYSQSTICFFHIYDAKLTDNRVRDYDNVETKKITDAIALFFLPDDSGKYCDTYHTTRKGCRDETQIWIMDSNIFPKWLYQQQL